MIILVAAAIALAIYRQFQARQLTGRSLLIIPLVLIGLGLEGLASVPPAGDLAIGVLAVNLLAGVGLGALRGRSVRIWQASDGSWWRKGTTTTLVLWVASIAVRLGIVAGARMLGVHDATSAGALELAVGISLGAQFATIAYRAGLLSNSTTAHPISGCRPPYAP
jgi:hypothetical protein